MDGRGDQGFARGERQRPSGRRVLDQLWGRGVLGAGWLVILIALLIFLGIFWKARPIFADRSLAQLFLSTVWNPHEGQFGLGAFIVGTLEVTLVAMLLAVPLSLLSATFLAEYVGSRFRTIAQLLVDLMAGIPSVIYGLFGVMVVVPLVRELGRWLGYTTTGYSLLSGGIVLSLMVAPVIISVSMQVLRSIPIEAREATLSLGSTRWEMVQLVLLRGARHGIISAVALGFTRAFGETIAVLMVIGNVAKVHASVLQPVYPLPALIANSYGEMMSVPLYDAALMLAALVLLVVVGLFNVAAHLALYHSERVS